MIAIAEFIVSSHQQSNDVLHEKLSIILVDEKLREEKVDECQPHMLSEFRARYFVDRALEGAAPCATISIRFPEKGTNFVVEHMEKSSALDNESRVRDDSCPSLCPSQQQQQLLDTLLECSCG